MRRRRPLPLTTIFLLAAGFSAVPASVDAAIRRGPGAATDDSPTAPPSDEGSDDPTESPPPTEPPTTVPTPPETTVPTPPETTVPTPPDTTVPTPPETTVPTPPDTTVPTPPETTVPTPPETTVPTPPETTVPTPPETTVPTQPDTPDETEAPPPVADAPVVDVDEPLEHQPAEPLPDGPLRTISFPVLGPVRYSNDWGACRDDCARRHEGNDLIGVRMQPLLAAVDGTVTRIRYENDGIAGSTITITGADGWYYNYFHVNNDTPGTDDGAAAREWQVAPPLTVGSHVRAGQLIGYMGDSGNSEGSVPHLHFEIRRPDRTPVNPYQSLVAAQKRETCTPGDAGLAASVDLSSLSSSAFVVVPLGGRGRWLIDSVGHVFAEGEASRIEPASGLTCEATPPLIEAVEADDEAVDVVDDVVQPLDEVEPTLAETVQPFVESTVPSTDPTPTATPTTTQWTVASGESLWAIAEQAYGVSDDATIAALVDVVFDHNRGLLTDPDLLEVGMILQLPPPPPA